MRKPFPNKIKQSNGRYHVTEYEPRLDKYTWGYHVLDSENPDGFPMTHIATFTHDYDALAYANWMNYCNGVTFTRKGG